MNFSEVVSSILSICDSIFFRSLVFWEVRMSVNSDLGLAFFIENYLLPGQSIN